MQKMTRWMKGLALASLAVTAGACADQSPTAPKELSIGDPGFSTSAARIERVVVMPGSATIAVGQNRSLIAIAYDSKGSILSLSGRSVTWKSSNPTAVKVTSTGIAKAITGGKATITATVDGVFGTSVITVDAPLSVASIKMHKTALSLALGQPEQVFATPTDPNGIPLAGHVITWRSSNPAVATVSSTGVVKPLADGVATITASTADASGTMRVTVTTTQSTIEVSLTGIAEVLLVPTYQMMEERQVRSMMVVLKDKNGRTIPLNGRRIAWASSNPAVASMVSAYDLKGWVPGFATISATVDGVTGYSEFAITKAY